MNINDKLKIVYEVATPKVRKFLGGIGKSYLLDDALQVVALKMLQYLQNGQGHLEGEDLVKYTRACCINMTIDYVRQETKQDRATREVPVLVEPGDLLRDPVINTEDYCEKCELCVLFWDKLLPRMVTPREYELMRAYYLDGKRYSEIARENDMTLGAVRNRIQIGIGHIRQHLEEEPELTKELSLYV